LQIEVRSDDYFRHRRHTGWTIRVDIIPTMYTIHSPRHSEIVTGAFDPSRIYVVPYDFGVTDTDGTSSSSPLSLIAPFMSHASHADYEFYDNPCWTGDARILMANGSYQRIDSIVPGDQVLSAVIKASSNVNRSSFSASIEGFP
jgi:hypothetical protein